MMSAFNPHSLTESLPQGPIHRMNMNMFMHMRSPIMNAVAGNTGSNRRDRQTSSLNEQEKQRLKKSLLQKATLKSFLARKFHFMGGNSPSNKPSPPKLPQKKVTSLNSKSLSAGNSRKDKKLRSLSQLNNINSSSSTTARKKILKATTTRNRKINKTDLTSNGFVSDSKKKNNLK